MYNIIRYRKLIFLLTGILLVGAVVALIVPPRLPFGLEFSSGTSISVDFKQPVKPDDVRAKLSSIGLDDSVVQATSDSSYFIRTKAVDQDLVSTLQQAFGPVRFVTFEGAAGLATTASFPNAVTADALRIGFGGSAPDRLNLQRLPDGRFFVSAPNLPDDRVGQALKAWQEQFGNLDRTDFNGPGNLAVVLKFQNATDVAAVAQEITRLGFDGVIATRISDTEVQLVARDLADKDRDTLLKGLKDKFGDSEQTPFDFSTGKAFTIRFTDPLTIDKVLQELDVFPASQVVGTQGAVQRIARGRFLVTSSTLTPQQKTALLSRLEESLGPLDVTEFDGQEDLALVLDFGPPVDLASFRAEANALGLQSLAVDAFGDNTFFAVGQNVTEQQRKDLLTRLESRFGLSRQTTYDGPDDLAVVMEFTGQVQRNDLIAEAQNRGLKEALVAPLGGSSFFIGSKSVPSETQKTVTDGLVERFGSARITKFSFETGIATTLNFGPPVTIDALRDEAGRAGPAGTLVSPKDQTSYLLTARGVTGEQRQALVSALETRFGPARQTPFDFKAGQVFSVLPKDPDSLAQGVRKTLIVQDAGNGSFFLAASRLTSAQRQLVLSTLNAAFGQPALKDFDFGAGLARTVIFDQPVTPDALKAALAPFGYADLTVEQRPDGLFMRGSRPATDQRSTILRALESLAPIDRQSVKFDSVNPEVARRSILNTFWAILISTFAILAYIWWAFRRLHRSFRYGLAAVLALAHDLLIIFGVLGLLAKFVNVQIDSLIVVGVLAVLGSSVNNTIVIFDRIRENAARHPGRDFESVANLSLNEALGRNLNTTITTVIAILAVLTFGGSTVRDFMVVLLVGVLAGWYDSQFLAASFLVAWQKGELPRLRLRLPFFSRRPATSP